MGDGAAKSLVFEAGTHYCAIFHTEEEWHECLVAFATAALARNDLFVYLHRHHTRDQIIAALATVPSAEAALASGQLLVVSADDDFYASAYFDPEEAEASWAQLARQAAASGYAGLSAAGEASCPGDAELNVARVVECQARVAAQVRQPRCTVLAQYDTRYLPPDLIAQSMQLHQRVIAGGRLHTNRYYVAPEQFVSDRRGESVLQGRLSALQAWTEQEDALRASEERYRLVADHSHDWEIWTLPSGEMTYVSPACERITGYAAEEFIGSYHSIDKIVHPDDLPRWQEHVEAALAGHQTSELEFRITHRNGELRWISHHCQPVYGEDGTCIGRRSTNRDVTDRIQAQMEVAESHRLLAAIMDQAPTAIVLLDRAGRVQLWNHAARDIFGWEAEEVIGKFNPLVPPEREPTYRRIRDLIARGDSFSAEVPCVSKDRGLVETAMSVTAIRESTGEVVALLGMLTDISARKRAEAAHLQLQAEMEAERLHFRTVFENAGVGVVVTDLDCRFLEVNPAFAAMLGYSRDEMLQLDVEAITAPGDYVVVLAGLTQLTSGDADDFRVEKGYLHKNGSIIWGSLVVTLIRDVAGNPSQLVAMVQDITASREAMLATQRLTAELEAIFSALTDAVVVYDTDWNILRANDNARRYCGEDLAEIGLPEVSERLQVRTPDGQPFPISEWPGETVLAGGSVTGLPVTITTVAGEERSISASATPLWLDGQVVAAVISWHDVTGRERAIKEAQRRAAELEAVISAIADAVSIWSVDHRLLHQNDAARRLLRRPDDASYDDPACCRDYYRPDGTAYPYEDLPLTRSLRGEVVTGQTIQIVWPDATSTWVNTSAAPLHAPDGEIYGAVITNTDLTHIREGQRERETLLEELRRHRDHLEDLVAQRTSELVTQQERLRAMALELSLAEERERRKIATIIHDDVAQTLAFSKMRVAALRTQTDPEVLREGHEHLAQLLDEAIQSSRRITMQLSPPVLYRMGFCPAIRWLGEEMQARHGYQVAVDICEEDLRLSEDVSVTLFQATRELLTNAAKHARAKQLSITVGRVERHVEVTVADDGVGFDPAQVQVTDSSGFGLLNIGERLACMDGGLHITSAPGAGATFILRAPLSPDVSGKP